MHTSLSEFFNTVLPQDNLSKTVVSIRNGYVQHGWGDGSLDHIGDFVCSADPEAQLYFALASYNSQSRKADVAANVKAFWLDLDAGEAKFSKHGDKVYPTQRDALVDLYAFCTFAMFPEPTYTVSSGAGVHAYWALDNHIPAARWQPIAKHFKAVLDEYGVRQDPARTADVASVLRIPCTLNLNMQVTYGEDDDPDFEREVKIIGGTRATMSLESIVVALVDTGVAAPVERPPVNTDRPIPVSFFKNIAIKSGEGTGCNQLLAIAECGGQVEEPLWRAALSVVNSCSDTDADKEVAMRMLSDLHPGFSIEETQRKAWATRGAQSCIQFENLNPAGCQGCRYRGTDMTSPRQLGYSEEPSRKENMAALKAGVLAPRSNTLNLPVVALGAIPAIPTVETKALSTTGDTKRAHFVNSKELVMFTEPTTGVEYRLGLWQSDGQGGVTLRSGRDAEFGVTQISTEKPKKRAPGEATGADDDTPVKVVKIILTQTIFMRERIAKVGRGATDERFVMVIEDANQAPAEIELSYNDIVSPPADLGKTLARYGVIAVNSADMMPIGAYLRAWRNRLSKLQAATAATIPAGWDGDTLKFGGYSYEARGKIPQPYNAISAGVALDDGGQAPSLEQWSKTTKLMYPNSMVNVAGSQFMLLAPLAAPIYSRNTTPGNVGGVIHFFSKDSGWGKSASVLRGCSAITNPLKLRVTSATTPAAFPVAQSNLNSFALLVDEVTTVSGHALNKFVFDSTEGLQKTRAVQGGGRLQDNEGQSWTSFCITTGNVSILEQTKASSSSKGAKGSAARVLELEASKIAYDKSISHLVDAHAGAVADAWFGRLVSYTNLKEDFAAFKAQLWEDLGGDGEDRFKVSMAASVLFTGQLLVEMGIVEFDMAAIRAWLISQMKQVKREAVADTRSPEQIVGEYINSHVSLTIVAGKENLFDADIPKGTQGVMLRLQPADNSVIVNEKHFRNWLVANEHSFRDIEKTLGSSKMRRTTTRLAHGHAASVGNPAVHTIKFTNLINKEPE